MVGAIITGCIVAAIIALAVSPVILWGSYEEMLTLHVRYLFLDFQLVPPKKSTKKEKRVHRKKQQEIQEEQKEEKEEELFQSLQKLVQEHGLFGLLSLLTEAAKIVVSGSKKLLSHLVIYDLWLDVQIAGQDAAETALTYGKACSVIYPSVGVLIGNIKSRRYGVSVRPDFQGTQNKIDCSWKIGIKVCFLISFAISTLIKAIPVLKKFQKGKSETPSKAEKA